MSGWLDDLGDHTGPEGRRERSSRRQDARDARLVWTCCLCDMPAAFEARSSKIKMRG